MDKNEKILVDEDDNKNSNNNNSNNQKITFQKYKIIMKFIEKLTQP